MASTKRVAKKKKAKKTAVRTRKKKAAKATKKASKKSPVPVASAPAEIKVAQSTSTAYTQVRELPMKERRKRLRALQNKANEANPGILVTADQMSSPWMLRRPTGIIELDIAIGGGFPAGGASVVAGPENSGKSWLMWRLFAMQQAIYGDDFIGAVANVEHPIPYDQAIGAGCKIAVPDEILGQWDEWFVQRGMPGLTGEQVAQFKQQVGTFIGINGVTGEDMLEQILSLTEQEVCSMIGVDSVSVLTPAADADKDLSDENKRAAHATMMKKFWMHFSAMVRAGTNHTSLIFTSQVVSNQERANMPTYIQKSVPEWELKGGWAGKHGYLITLLLYSGEKIKRSKDSKDILGKYIKYQTKKGKAGAHDNVYGEFPYYYHLKGVDSHGELIASAIQRGILVNISGTLQVLNGTTREPIAGMFAPDDKTLRQMLEADFDFELALRREVLASADIQCLYR